MDGVSPHKAENKNTIKHLIKKNNYKNAKTIFANGLSAKRIFNE